MSLRHALALVGLVFSVTGTAEAKFMPDNNLDQQDSLESTGGITQAQFNAVIDRAERIFKPIVAGFGATYTVNRRWTDTTVNADASQSGNSWLVNMYGGLARRAEVTEDGFAAVLCHETGHHLGGYPFYRGDNWAANEGQSDTFTAGNCVRLLWKNDPANANSRATVPVIVKAKCDAAYSTTADQDLCYRAMNASKSTADLLAALGGDQIAFDTPDTNEVDETKDEHPAAQCRLDTYVAAALCSGLTWDTTVIPGKVNNSASNDAAAQASSGRFYCQNGTATPGALRPRCWFKSL